METRQPMLRMILVRIMQVVVRLWVVVGMGMVVWAVREGWEMDVRRALGMGMVDLDLDLGMGMAVLDLGI